MPRSSGRCAWPCRARPPPSSRHPLNKAALNLAGYHFPGHTELLAHLTGTRGTVLMLAHGSFRVSHVTTHVALEKVPGLVTPERIRRVVDLTIEAMQHLGIERPRIAVAALNPHAGEGGIFGRQDIDITEPLVADYQARGLAVEGPVPGDTVFVKMRGGQYDAVVAMYHDQGHVPTKLLGFDIDPVTGKWKALSGVNVTLGLPIIRTSVDHGTAFDIAGKGVADATQHDRGHRLRAAAGARLIEPRGGWSGLGGGSAKGPPSRAPRLRRSCSSAHRPR